MLEKVKKHVKDALKEAEKYDMQYLPWEVVNAQLLIELSEQVEKMKQPAIAYPSTCLMCGSSYFGEHTCRPKCRHLQECQHDSIMIAFYPSPETAQQLAIPGGEDPSELHITLCYCGKLDEFTADLEHLKATVAQFASNNTPLGGSIGGIGRFTPSEHSENLSPVIALVNVPGLQEFRRSLASILDSAGVFIANDYDYTPHITLAYVDPDAPMPIQNIEPLPLAFDTLWLCIGDQRIPYPLGKLPDQTYNYKVEMIGKNGQVLARSTDTVTTWEGFDRLISGGTPHAQEEKDTQDQKESVETLPEDDGSLAEEEDLGDPLDWSDADLDKLAEIGEDDLANAVKLWDDNAPEGFAGLLNAEVEQNG